MYFMFKLDYESIGGLLLG